MSLLDVLRSGVKIIDNVTKPLQAEVLYSRYVSSDAYGKVTYSPLNKKMKAIVDLRQTQVRTTSGVLSMCRATVMFVDVDAVVSATAGEGVSDRDRIILPDGKTGPILNFAGFVDAGTTKPIATEVFLG